MIIYKIKIWVRSIRVAVASCQGVLVGWTELSLNTIKRIDTIQLLVISIRASCQRCRPPLADYHILCRCKFLLKTERTSLVKRSASRTGRRFRSAVSLGSQNHDLIGIALSVVKWKSRVGISLITDTVLRETNLDMLDRPLDCCQV